MYRHLVVPLDGSAMAEPALGRAAAIAQASGASIDLVLVHAPTPLENPGTATWELSVEGAARHYLETIVRELETSSGQRVTFSLRKGDPVDEICDRAAEVGADLIVMTSHGRTGFSRVWFGSVADGVMRRSRIPVLMLRPIPSVRQRDLARRPFTHVLVPLDGVSMEAVPSAVALAQCGGARVTLLHVVQPIPLPAVDPIVPYAAMAARMDEQATKAVTMDMKARLVETARRLADETGLPVEAQVLVEGAVASAIISFAHGAKADVIALATHRGPAGRLILGSVADKLVRGADLPVLLLYPH